ncbi:DUF3224 domain-containing protein [Lapillicoccus sp.]|uniref:DUF3224 domain-containing protein n=1 Tax=Lapillicoccus sp. TaxID=1909287 RepID=UPI0025DF0CE9|nr:DUF3224 domain-containing protein [Lapillicoccus sp.]
MTHHEHATGTFTIDLRPADGPDGPNDPEGLGRFEFDKEFHGDLVATSRGAMLSAGDPSTGSAGYVVVEIVEGRIGDREGRFALQHSGVMDAGEPTLVIAVVPGSGTGGFAGIRGDFELTVDEDGSHRYELSYSVPPTDVVPPD